MEQEQTDPNKKNGLVALIHSGEGWFIELLLKYFGESIGDLINLLSICKSLNDPDVMIHLGNTEWHDPDLSELSRMSSSPWVDRIKMPKCRKIEFSYLSIDPIDPNVINIMAKWCPNVEILDLSHCNISDEGLIKIAKEWPHLKSLHLNYSINREITDEGVRAVAQRCHDLRSFNLGGCDNISDAGVTAVAQGCPDLKFLDLSACYKIVGICLTELLDKNNLKNLKSLNLSGCFEITNIAVIAVIVACPDLQSLNLGGCYNICDAGVTALAQMVQRCPHLQSLNPQSLNLQSLNLENCKQITDAGVTVLAQLCPHLHSLDLSGCRNITDAGVTELARGCQYLQLLNLYGCNRITDNGIKKVVEKCPHLQSLDLSR